MVVPAVVIERHRRLQRARQTGDDDDDDVLWLSPRFLKNIPRLRRARQTGDDDDYDDHDAMAISICLPFEEQRSKCNPRP